MHPKLCFFDLEGTLFKKSYHAHGGREFASAWGALCAILGPEAEQEDARNRERFYSNGYARYSDWVVDTVRIHQKYGLSRSTFDEVIYSVDYHDGADQLLTTLASKGIRVAVISGGLKALADRVATDHKVEHCFASAEYYWDVDGMLHHWNIMPTDFENKRHLAEMLCKDLGIAPEECLFVGDGLNDVAIAGYVGTSIAFNAHDDLKAVATHTVNQEKGREDLSFLLNYIP